MQIELASSFLKPEGETKAKAGDTAAAGPADSFFAQMGQMMNADSPEADVRNEREPEGQGLDLCCTNSRNPEPGESAAPQGLADTEAVQKLDWTFSDTSAPWDMAPALEANAAAAELQLGFRAADFLPPSRPQEWAQDGEEPSPIGTCNTVSDSSPLPMYLSSGLDEFSAMSLNGDCQNIDKSADLEGLTRAVSDAAESPVDIGINNNIFSNLQTAFPVRRSEETAGETKNGNPDSAKTALPAADGVPAETGGPAPTASAAKPVNEKMVFLKADTSQKGLTVDPAPVADFCQELDLRSSPTPLRDGADTAGQSLLPRSYGIPESPSPAIRAVRKPEQDVSADTGKTDYSNNSPTAPKDESVGHAFLQARSESRFMAPSGIALPSGKERAQEVHTAAWHHSARAVDGSNAAAAAEPAVQGESRQFIHQLADQIQVLVRDGKGDIRIQLKPDVLGRIEIKAEATPSGVVARITTESSAVRNHLESNIQVLQQTLADQGLRVDRIQIVAQDSFDAQFSSGRNTQFGHAGSGRNGRNAESFGRALGPNAISVSEEIALDRALWLSLNPDNKFYTVA